jgi:hypothetical protein
MGTWQSVSPFGTQIDVEGDGPGPRIRESTKNSSFLIRLYQSPLADFTTAVRAPRRLFQNVIRYARI